MKLMMITKIRPSTRFQRSIQALTTFLMMMTMAVVWKRSVAVAEVVVTGVAMAAARHLADYHR